MGAVEGRDTEFALRKLWVCLNLICPKIVGQFKQFTSDEVNGACSPVSQRGSVILSQFERAFTLDPF
jgi:hypothetical protein